MKSLLPGAVAILVGCGSSGPRPLKPQIEETVTAPPSVVFQAALKAVTDQGLPLREADPTTEVIQTNYVDIASYDPLASTQYPAAERLIRVRILVAPNREGPGTTYAIFGIYSPFRTGYSSSDRNERTIPRDHPGMAVVRRIRDDIAKTAGR